MPEQLRPAQGLQWDTRTLRNVPLDSVLGRPPPLATGCTDPAPRPAPPRGPDLTFALPVRMRGEAHVASVLAVELGHERLVGVADEQHGGVEGLDLLAAALVRLDADGPPAAPVVPLALEP